jgi:hypothetical protein
MDKINLEKLSVADRKALMAELVADQKKEKQRKQEDRTTYRKLVDENIPELFKHLAYASEILTKAKKKVFEETKDLVDLKNSIYGVKIDQQSHTFSTSAGDFTITRGFRIIDGWDDTYMYGVEKIKEYLGVLATDPNPKVKISIKIVQRLLRPDKKGILKASRVIELANMATEISGIAPDVDHALFYEGIEILQAAFRPMKSVTFIEASWRDENGHTHGVPLSISACDLE